MKKRIVITMVFFIGALISTPALAGQGHGGHGSDSGKDMKPADGMDHGARHTSMDHAGMGGTFKHTASQGGIDAVFQVMRLDSMNMTSDQGDTHHIMVNLNAADSGASIKKAIGKIKVIAPDKTEQISPLKNYDGILAANFTFIKPGKYGVICLLKHNDQKQVFKFWYDFSD
ncbi:MAG: hypothetical protein HKP58_05445 [Desulfatitalea sp.]|nr:hypothetical protein [Desulfatitalea sp.]NNJ99838.1 hypothetical protein [Desulfatitalea sp.]